MMAKRTKDERYSKTTTPKTKVGLRRAMKGLVPAAPRSSTEEASCCRAFLPVGVDQSLRMAPVEGISMAGVSSAAVGCQLK